MMPQRVRLLPSDKRVLATVYAIGEPTTALRVAATLGLQKSSVALSARRLRALGLVKFEDKKFATLRPACRFIPAADL